MREPLTMRIDVLSVLRVLLGVLVMLLSGCASMDQTENEVFKRQSGGRLKPWVSVQEAWALHWAYA